MKERGSAVVEFALVLPLILVLVVATVEVGLVARTQLELVNAAREGARQAATHPDTTKAVAAAKAALAPGTARMATISVSRPHVVGAQAAVAIAVRHRVAAPLLGGFDVNLHARAVMRVEQ